MVRRKRRGARGGASPPARIRRWAGRWAAALGRAAGSRLRPWRPAVETDVSGTRGRRLRRAVARVTRNHLRALGVAPPGHLLVVVQRTVTVGERQLASLLQVFEDADGRTRHVLYVALSVGGRRLSDEDAVATLRQQLRHVVGAELGALRVVALEAAAVPAATGDAELAAEPEVEHLEEALPPARVGADTNGAFPVDLVRAER